MSLGYEVIGARKVALKLGRYARRSNNLRGVNARIATDMMASVRINFSSQGRRGGGSWQFLSADRVRQKAAKPKTGKQILVDSGRLRDSVTVKGAPHQILRITNSSVTLGTNLEYGKIHQEGLGEMPARPFLDFVPGDMLRWEAMIVKELRGAYNGVR